MGEIVEWEIAVDLDKGAIIKPDRCDWYREFLIAVHELKNTSGIGGDAHFQAILDYCKIITLNKVRFPISTISNGVVYLCLVHTLPIPLQLSDCHHWPNCKPRRDFRRCLCRIGIRH